MMTPEEIREWLDDPNNFQFFTQEDMIAQMSPAEIVEMMAERDRLAKDFGKRGGHALGFREGWFAALTRLYPGDTIPRDLWDGYEAALNETFDPDELPF